MRDSVTLSPISGATVNLYRPGGILAHTATTNGLGYYTITGNPQNYILTVEKNGYQIFTSSVKLLSNGLITVDVYLNGNPGAIFGTVSGPPVGTTTLQLFLNNILILTTTTNGSNQYSFSNLAPGNYTVSASSPNYATQILGATVTSNTTTPLNFTMVTTVGNLTGNVSNGTNPIVGAVVQVKINGTVIQQTVTDSSGNYAVNNLLPRTYNVLVTAEGYNQQIQGIEIVNPGDTVNLNFILSSSPGTLTGFVYDTQLDPIAGAFIQVYLANVLVFSTFTSIDGSYTISGIAPPATYTVVASAVDYGSVIQGALIEPNKETKLNFTLVADTEKTGILTGNVQDSSGNLGGVLLQVILNNVVVATAVTDSSGNYTFLTLAPNTYVINPILANYGSVPQGAIIQSNMTTTLNFTLVKETGELDGNVQDSSGNLGGVLLQAILNNVVVATAVTDSSGNYTFLTLAPNTYVINPILANYGSVPQGAIIQSNMTTTLNFTLVADTGKLDGNVQDISGNLGGVLLQAILNNVVVATAVTDSSGNYTFLTLAPNTYVINPILANYGSVPQGAIIQSNMTTTLNFTLVADAGILNGNVQDDLGRDLSGVFIQAILNNLILATTLTDNSGNYSFLTLAPGNYMINPTLANYIGKPKSATLVSGQTVTLNFVLNEILGPPQHLVGEALVNQFLLKADRIHALRWQPSVTTFVSAYIIYRNTVLLAVIPSSQALVFEDHNRSSNQTDFYQVCSFRGTDNRSSFSTVSLS